MGTNNRQRRAAKRRKRGGGRPPGPPSPKRQVGPPVTPVAGPRDGRSADEIVADAMRLDGSSPGSVETTRRLADRPPDEVIAAFEGRLTTELEAAWARGWEPVALDRQVARLHPATGLAPLLRAVMGVAAVEYAALGARVAPRWMAQLDELGVRVADDAFSLAFAGAPATEDGDAVSGCLLLALTLPMLGSLPGLVDPPQAWREDQTSVTAGEVPASLLARIRALLAKAESTEFTAEAEAFTAKAQELMARHRVDRALLADEEPVERLADGVVGRRLGIDDPYATAKFHLLASIGEVNGARSIWSKSIGMATVFGFPVEVDIIE